MNHIFNDGNFRKMDAKNELLAQWQHEFSVLSARLKSDTSLSDIEYAEKISVLSHFEEKYFESHKVTSSDTCECCRRLKVVQHSLIPWTHRFVFPEIPNWICFYCSAHNDTEWKCKTCYACYYLNASAVVVDAKTLTKKSSCIERNDNANYLP